MNIQQIKKEIMTISRGNEHRMTTFNGTPISYKGAKFFSSTCKDCGKSVRVHLNGTVDGDAHTIVCEPTVAGLS